MLGKGQVLVVVSMLLGVLLLFEITYITVSPIMWYTFLITLGVFALVTIMGLNPTLSASLLSSIFGTVKLPEGKEIDAEKGILYAKFGDFWYATKYITLNIVRSLTVKETEPEAMQYTQKMLGNLINSLGSLGFPVTIMVVFTEIPEATSKIEKYLREITILKSLPPSSRGISSIWQPTMYAKAQVKYDTVRELFERVKRGERVFEMIALVRVTHWGTTKEEARNNVEKATRSVIGIIASLPTINTKILTGEELMRIINFDYGYSPKDILEFRDQFSSFINRNTRLTF